MTNWMVSVEDGSFFDTRASTIASVAARTGAGAGSVMREHQGALRAYARDGGRLFLFGTVPEIATLAADGSGTWAAGKWHHTVVRSGQAATVASRRAGRTSIGAIDASAADFEGRVITERGELGAVVVAGRLVVEQDGAGSRLGALLAGGKGRAANEVILRVGELRQSFLSPGQPAMSAADAAKTVLGTIREARKDRRHGTS